MKKATIMLLIALFAINLNAQKCISGNCNNGKGQLQIGNDVFTGHFKDGKRYGYGEILRDNGTTIKGFFINNYINGASTTITKDGHVLLRNYVNEVMYGKSIFTAKNGDITEEYYNEDTLNGLSILNTSSKIYSKSFWIQGQSLGKIYYRSENVPDFYFPKKSNEVVTDDIIGPKLVYSTDGTFSNIPGGENLDGNGYYFDGKNDKGYFGGYKKGYKHGMGTSVYGNGTFYRGEYKKASWIFGTYKDASYATVYIGEFNDGKYDGKGILKSKEGFIYTGEFKKDKFHGKGKKTNYDESEYEGEFEIGEYSGTGKLTSPNKKSSYLGEWKNNKRNGKGVITYLTGYTEVGTWLNGIPQNTKYFDATKKEITKEAFYDVVDVYEPYIHFWQTNITKYKYIYKDFAIFDGLANETSAEGFGVYIDKKMYIGNWVNDKRNGTGTEYLNNGNYAVGTWINNEKSVVTYYNFKGNEITKEEYEKE